MTLRGAMIGCGYISQQQLLAWKQIEGVEIVAVCDLDLVRARHRAEEFGIAFVFDDYQRMLDEQPLDFVDIATRPMSHLELVRAGAARGLHVLCQKPVAESLEDLRAMIAACDQANVLFMVNENYRHQAWYRKLKELLNAGALGLPYNARFHSRWRSTLPTLDFEGQDYFQEMRRLVVFEGGVHYLDTARYLFGEAQTIFARLARISPHIAGEDMALIVADFGALTCLVDCNWYAVPEAGPPGITTGKLVVEGSEATATLAQDGTLSLQTADQAQVWHFAADTIARSFVATQRHFVDCMRSGAAPETSGRESLRTMALVFGAYRSSEERRAVRLSEFDLVRDDAAATPLD